MDIYFSWGFVSVVGAMRHETNLFRKLGFLVAEGSLSAKSPQLAKWNYVKQIVKLT